MENGSREILIFWDWIFHFLHVATIIINTTFWWWSRTLRIAQITLFATAISWFLFGIKYGWGYCFLTDWQWQVKVQLGERNLPLSYIEYLLDRTSLPAFSSSDIEFWTLIVLLISILGCFWKSQRLTFIRQKSIF